MAAVPDPPRRLHPVTRLALCLPVLALLPVGGPAALAFATLACLPVAAASGLGCFVLRRMALLLLPVALALALVHGLLIARGPATVLGPVAIYPAGLAHAGMILLRLAALLAAGLMIVGSTTPGELADGLEDKGLPSGIAYLLTAPLSLAQGLALEGAALRDALQLRGLPLSGSPRQRLRAISHIAIALIRLQLVEAAPRAQMLEARGFRSQPCRTLLAPPPDTPGQYRLRLASALLAACILILGMPA